MALEKEIRTLTESLHFANIHRYAQQDVIEKAHAQLIVQNIYATKLNEALNVKEKGMEKEDNHTKLFPDGKGRHLPMRDSLHRSNRLQRTGQMRRLHVLQSRRLDLQRRVKRIYSGPMAESQRKA